MYTYEIRNQRIASVKSPEINISTRVNNQRWRQNHRKQKKRSNGEKNAENRKKSTEI